MRVESKRLATIVCVAFMSFGVGMATAQTPTPEMPAEYKSVLQAPGKTGDFKANVLKVNVPRNDLSVTVAGVKTPAPFGFRG